MTDRSLSLCFAFFIPILFTVALPFTAGDLSVWIAHGESFLQTGQILRHDVFSILPTSELVYPSFGISVVYALLYRCVGLLGVCLFHDIAVLAGILALIYRPLIREGILPEGKNLKWFLFLFWLGAVPAFVERPAMIALLPLIYAYQMISRLQNRPHLTDSIKLLALMVIWSNLHGSFILLPLMLAWKFRLKALPFILGTLVVSCFNPFGWKIYPYLMATARLSKERGISEWNFPGLFTQFPTGFLFWGVVGFALIFLYRAYQERRFWDAISDPYFLFLVLGTLSVRNAALGFVLILPAARNLGWIRSMPADAAMKHVAPLSIYVRVRVMAALALILAIPMVIVEKPHRWDETVAFRLADAVRADGRTCTIFNSWELGSFLMLELKNKIYLDTRNIIYKREEFDAYQRALAGEGGWAKFLDDGNTCFVMVDHDAGRGLLERLKSSTLWEYKGSEGKIDLYAKKFTHSP